jgi:hypothetical protein
MFDRLSNWLYHISTGWVPLAGLVIFLLFTVLVLPRQSASADEVSADAGTPDLSLFYTPDDLYRMAEAYGEAGRQAFVRARLTFDVVWPFVYLFFLSTSTSWLLKRGLPADSRALHLNLLPASAALLDFLENFANILVMLRYPAHTPVIYLLAPIFTFTKWSLVGASFIVLLAGIGMVLIKSFRRRKHVA